MTKLEFLATSLHYDLKVKEIDLDLVFSLNIKLLELISLLGFDGQYLPIIRPLGSLTKECVQSNYNGGEPFYPIDELKLTTDCDNDMDFLDAWEERGYGALMIPNMPLKFAQLLIKWHFWPNMPQGEQVVYVTDEFNPYK